MKSLFFITFHGHEIPIGSTTAPTQNIGRVAGQLSQQLCALPSRFAPEDAQPWGGRRGGRSWSPVELGKLRVEGVAHGSVSLSLSKYLVKLLYFTGRGSKFIFQGMELSKVAVI